jgi:hypothetical protein
MISANRYISVLMIIGMLMQINVVMTCYGLYFVNRKAIAETSCEKKVKDCCGHCFLKKKIAAATDDPATPSEKQIPSKTLEELLGSQPGMLPGAVYPFAKIPLIVSYSSRHTFFLLDGASRKIDHPPNA